MFSGVPTFTALKVCAVKTLVLLLVSYLDCELLPGTQAVGHDDAELLLPAELQGVCVLLGKELKRHDTHSHQLVLVELLKALGDDRTDALLMTEKRVSGKSWQGRHSVGLTVWFSFCLVSSKRRVCRAVYQQVRSFGYPVPGVSRAIVFPRQDDEGSSFFLVALSCLKDIQLIRQAGSGHVMSSSPEPQI